MNPRIKDGWDYFWNLKPSQAMRMENGKLLMIIHNWQKMILEERNGDKTVTEMSEEDIKNIFST